MEYNYKQKEFYYPYILVLFIAVFVSLGMAVRFSMMTNTAILVVFYVAIFVLFGLLGFFLYLLKKKYNYAPPIWTCIIPLVIIIINIIMVSTTPDVVNVSFYDVQSNYITSPFKLLEGEKLFYIAQYICLIAGIYIGVCYIPKIVNSRIHLPLALYLVYAFVGVCIIASLIMEFNSYISFFTSFKDYISGRVLTTKSFFDHRNTWGAMLLISIVGSIFLYVVSKKKWAIWPMLVSLIFMVFTLSKGSLILALIALIAFLIYWLITTYKEHKVRNLIVVSSVATILLTGVILFFALKVYDYYAFSDDSFMSRTIIWRKLFYVTRNMPYPLFGLGYGVASKTILEFNDADVFCEPNWHVPNAHNIYVEFYGYSGIIGMLTFIGAYIYVIYDTVKKWKKDREVSFFLLLAEFIVAIYWMIEG